MARELTPIVDHPEEMAKLPASFVAAEGNIIVALGLLEFDNTSVLDVLRWIPTPLIESVELNKRYFAFSTKKSLMWSLAERPVSLLSRSLK